MGPTNFGERLSHWMKKFSQYKIGYKNGFFEISNLANSPELIIKSLARMPFVEQDKEKGVIKARLYFMKVDAFFRFTDEDTSFFISTFNFRYNVTMKNVFDTYIPVKYYFLNIFTVNKETNVQQSKAKMLSNSDMLKNKTWSLNKPGS